MAHDSKLYKKYDCWQSKERLREFLASSSVEYAFRTDGECITEHTRILRLVGFLRSDGRAHATYRAATLALTAVYLFQECVYAYRARSDMAKLSRVMFLLLCHVTSLAKQIVFHIDADRIDKMIKDLDGPLYNSGGERPQRLRATTRVRARRMVRVYAGCAVVTCTLWLVFPALDRAHGCFVDFPFYTGLRADHPLVFTLVLLYSYYVTTLIGIANTTMDALIATILYQCQTQFKILRYELETLPENALSLSINTGLAYNRALMVLFVERLHHYKSITEMAQLLQDIFNNAILVQFGIGGWILCMAAYKLVTLNLLSIEFASMTLFIFCILTELFLYCYYGTELTVESEQLAGSVYAMRWLHSNTQFRRALVLLMERARRPVRPAAGRVVPLSLDTFLKILKSSYTFYAVLRQTK